MKTLFSKALISAVLALISCAAPAIEGVPEAYHGFPRDLTLEPGKLYYMSNRNMGRITAIAYHNGFIYTQNVAGGSPRVWQFSNNNDPGSLQLLGSSRGFLSGDGSHGYHVSNGGYLNGIFAQSPGVNVDQSDNDPERVRPRWMRPPESWSGRDGRSGSYYPWETPFTWHQYGSATGNTYLRRDAGDPLIHWNWFDIGATHLGKAVLMGDILILVDDLTNGGVTTFDISPVFADPPRPPQLLDHINRPTSEGGLGTYLPQLWGSILVLHSRNNRRADFVDIRDPHNLKYLNTLDLSWNQNIEPGNNDLYAQAQDEYVFTRRAKIDMTGLLEEGGNAEIVLRFDITGDNRPTGSLDELLDISQYLYPMGNLLITGPYSYSGRDSLGVWAHQAEPDTRAPYVSYHRPENGQTNFPLGAPVSILINESLAGETLVDGLSVILRPLEGEPLTCYVSHSHDDILTITPVEYLQPNTTYEVVLPAGGLRDVANNPIEEYSFRFSTGNTVQDGGVPPEIAEVLISPDPQTLAPGNPVTFTVNATHPNSQPLEYRFTAGDGTPRTDWAAGNVFQHTYATEGHFAFEVQVRDPDDDIARAEKQVTIMESAPSVAATNSGPIWLHQATRRLWVVNPDNDSVAALDADTHQLETVVDLTQFSGGHPVDPRSVAVDAWNQVWIAAHDDDALYVLDGANGGLIEILETGYGSAPAHVLASPDGSTIFASLTARGTQDRGNGQLYRFDAGTRQLTGSLELGPQAWALAMAGDRVFVSRFISGQDYGEIWEANNGTSLTLTRSFQLLPDRGPDENNLGRGVPNYIAGLAITPDGSELWYSAIKANVNRGLLFGGPATHDNTVRAMAGIIDLTTNQEEAVENLFGASHRIDIDNSDSPTAISFTPRGDWAMIALQGNDSVAVFDRLAIRNQPTDLNAKVSVWRIGTGSAPQGVRFDPVERTLFVKNFLSRDVGINDLSTFLDTGLTAEAELLRRDTVPQEKMDPEVLHGKVLFYLAGSETDENTRSAMSLETYLSCATCHIDGGTDNRVFDFTQRGEGLRNTTDLRGRGGVAHGNVHWSGNFDEIQDFELDIVNHFGGFGLLLAGDDPHASLGTPNAGRSPDLDALAAYVTSLNLKTVPRSPYRAWEGSLTPEALAGSVHFAALDCMSCHSPQSEFTDSTLGTATLHQVGTIASTSGTRLGQNLPGIDTPTLHGVWTNAPYLHDGSAPDLKDVFQKTGGTVIQAEDGTPGSGAQVLTDSLDHHDDSAYADQFVRLDAIGQTLEFSSIDGQGGGSGQLYLRVNAPVAALLEVQVNAQTLFVDIPAATGISDWQWVAVPAFSWAAGSGNTVTLTHPGAGLVDLDAVLVTPPDLVQAADPHRAVLTLTQSQREELYAYLLSLDGERGRIPQEPGYKVINRAISMEAEHAQLTEDTLWRILPQPDASNGEVLDIDPAYGQTGGSPNSSNPSRMASFPFSAKALPGSYSLYVRVFFENFSDDSFFWRLDDGSWVQQNNTIGMGNWIQLATGLSLSDAHTLQVTYRENGSLLDKFLLIPDGDPAPVDGTPGPDETLIEAQAETTYAAWAEGIDWGGEPNDPQGFAFGHSLKNLGFYGMNLRPSSSHAREALPKLSYVQGSDGAYLSVLYRERIDDPTLSFEVRACETPGGTWELLDPAIYDVTTEIVNPDATGDGTTRLVLKWIRIEGPQLYVKIVVRQNP